MRVTREFNWVEFVCCIILTVGILVIPYLILYGLGLMGREERKYICGNCRNVGCLVPTAPGVGYYTEPETKKYPECAEIVKREAKICRFCGYRFEPPERAPIGS